MGSAQERPNVLAADRAQRRLPQPWQHAADVEDVLRGAGQAEARRSPGLEHGEANGALHVSAVVSMPAVLGLQQAELLVREARHCLFLTVLGHSNCGEEVAAQSGPHAWVLGQQPLPRSHRCTAVTNVPSTRSAPAISVAYDNVTGRPFAAASMLSSCPLRCSVGPQDVGGCTGRMKATVDGSTSPHRHLFTQVPQRLPAGIAAVANIVLLQLPLLHCPARIAS
mmetsp:Transcript_49269/g.107197  ORF Transcript_49269/g.107197 Transcript_49269/m.107197 type:complete len:224 (+) Transcript_49269:212-883(+)